MSRVEDQQLLAELERLQRDIQELKQQQLLGGSSVLGYLTSSANKNDFSTVLTAGQTKTFTLTFTHDHSLKGSIQQLFFFFSIDQTDVMSFYVPPWGSGVITAKLLKLTPTDAANTWRFSLANTDSVQHTAYVKLFFSGTDSGSWNIA